MSFSSWARQHRAPPCPDRRPPDRGGVDLGADLPHLHDRVVVAIELLDDPGDGGPDDHGQDRVHRAGRRHRARNMPQSTSRSCSGPRRRRRAMPTIRRQSARAARPRPRAGSGAFCAARPSPARAREKAPSWQADRSSSEILSLPGRPLLDASQRLWPARSQDRRWTHGGSGAKRGEPSRPIGRREAGVRRWLGFCRSRGFFAGLLAIFGLLGRGGRRRFTPPGAACNRSRVRSGRARPPL